jgi:hypothetical protein
MNRRGDFIHILSPCPLRSNCGNTNFIKSDRFIFGDLQHLFIKKSDKEKHPKGAFLF